MSVHARSIVIRTASVETTATFYRLLGMEFVEERHGNGPTHLTATLGDFIFEIYPLRSPQSVEERERLGFWVSDFEDVVSRLEAASTFFVRRAAESAWGLHAVVRDPDGRSIEIYRANPSQESPSLNPSLIAERIAATIASLYQRPQMYVGARSEAVALESLLWMMHSIWAESCQRSNELHRAQHAVLSEEQCGANSFLGTFRAQHPAATDDEAGEYVLSCWMRISRALAIIEPPQGNSRE